jgi:hypothetical protein
MFSRATVPAHLLTQGTPFKAKLLGAAFEPL